MAGYLPNDYVWVHTRVEKYHSEHDTDMNINTEFQLQGDVAIFKATVKTKKWEFTGSSFWKMWREKAFEKLETVAVGRALAFAGYEVKSWIASSEEMEEFVQKESIQQKSTTPKSKWGIIEWKCNKCGANALTSKAWNQYCKCWY